jgi:hypothetical protein
MSEILKPSNLSNTWASGGDILDPGTSKYLQGWEVEIPPRQWFNFLDNRQDEAIAHINQHGITVWDNATEYQASKSYVQGSNGNVYRALTTNTNIDPVSDGGTNWQALFLTRLATTGEAQGWTSDLVTLSPLKLAESFKGANQQLSGSGFQKMPGGFIIQWGAHIPSGANIEQSVVFPTTFPTTMASLSILGQSVAATLNSAWRTDTPTTSGFKYATNTAGGNSVFYIAIGF